ncbi:MAG: hypothetical protein KAI66_08255 [Lentisphaeria bacterium]|nr:hypothetical protein [Lentisphaeria bacterium]
MAVYGGFDGTETELGSRDPGTNETILSGDIGTAGTDTDSDGVPDDPGGDSGDNSYCVVYNPNLTPDIDETAVLDGFTVTAGNADGSASPPIAGGGIRNINASPAIVNCTIVANSTADRAGGMYNSNSSPTLSHCTFRDNSTTKYGGAIHNFSSSPTLRNCMFIGNNSVENGGAIFNSSSSPALTNCTIVANNASTLHGGGIFNQSSSPTLSNCILWGNTAGGAGASVHNLPGSIPSFDHCIVEASGGSASWVGAFGTDLGGNLDTDPLFVDDTDPDGADRIPRTADDGLEVLPSSPPSTREPTPERRPLTSPAPTESIQPTSAPTSLPPSPSLPTATASCT